MKETKAVANHYQTLLKKIADNEKALAILIDPDKFNCSQTNAFIKKIPNETTHLFVGGSTDINGNTEKTVLELKKFSALPIFLFPGDVNQIVPQADALLFLSLLSGRNAEYLIGQQVKAIEELKKISLEVISTGYILIDGGTESSVARVSNTKPISQNDIETIVNTALAGQYLGAKLIYLEAGSGAKTPVNPEIISEVKKAINSQLTHGEVPLVVGGGIKTEVQMKSAYDAGADMVVMGTAFE